MNRSATQFAVAIIGMSGLIIALLVSICFGGDDKLTFMLAGGLVSTTSGAAAWLFRLNGSA